MALDGLVRKRMLDAVSRFHAEHAFVPAAQRLSEKFSSSLIDAHSVIEEFLTTSGEARPVVHRVAKVQNVVGEKVLEQRKTNWIKRLSDWGKTALDKVSFWLAIAVDIVLSAAGGWTIGPDPVLKIGLIAILCATVFFLARAWVKKLLILWLVTMASVLFMDTSMALEATRVQSSNAAVDTQLDSLNDRLKKAQEYLEALQAKQLTEGSGYRDQIETARSDRDSAQKAKDAYQASPHEQVKVSASKVATAIPDAMTSGQMDRIILCIVFFNLFLGLQIGMVSSTGVRWKDMFEKKVAVHADSDNQD